MFRSSFIFLFFLSLTIPSYLCASDDLAILEEVAAASTRTQPGLQNYLVTVETARIEEMMSRMTTGMPADVAPPTPPVIVKFWQRNGKGLVYARQELLTPYVEKMVSQISDNLAIELNEMLLPAVQSKRRQELVKGADIKSSEVALANNLIHRLEISFKDPADLNGAFYASGIRLPQKQIKSLTFDIDAKTDTVREMALVTDSGLHLTVEIHYLEVTGGLIPERFQITSPDGKTDDRFEVKFIEVDSFLLPASMLRVIQRPELQETLEVFFKGYQVNQPIPEDIQARLKGHLTQ